MIGHDPILAAPERPVAVRPSRTVRKLGRVDKQDSQISRVLIQGSFGGGYHDPGFVERQGVGLS